MSGSAVFCGDFLIGVVSGDPLNWLHSRVEAIPASTLVEDSDFSRVCRDYTGHTIELADLGEAESSLDPGRWTPVDSAEPDGFGVHQAQASTEYPAYVEYIPREIDFELDQHVSAVARTGGLLIVTGDSAAGKTRALFEAMTRMLADWQVCHPDPDEDLSFLTRPSQSERRVIWLDDFHSYLRSDGITPRLLGEITRRGDVLLATLRSEFYEHYCGEKGARSLLMEDGSPLPSGPSRVIRSAKRIALDRTWSDVERQRAAQSSDPRVEQALEADRAYGLAEYLAAGPQVLTLWRDASRAGGNPRGAALVAAAVALARTGLDRALPAAAIESLHEYFLDEAGGPRLRPEPLQEAWQWASKIMLGVTSPLEPAKGGKWKAFDYLVSDSARRSETSSLPSPVWDLAVQLAEDSRRSLMSIVAKIAGRVDIAISLLRPLAESNDVEGMNNLGAVLAGEHEYEGAREWFMRASELDDSTAAHNMGCIYFETNDLHGALEWFTLAIERGEVQSYAPLGAVHQKMGDEPQAVELWRTGTDRGDAASALQYSDWLRSKWMSDEAVEALRVAADGEIPFAALSYAGVLLSQKKNDEASEYVSKAYRIASQQGRLGDSLGFVMAGVIAHSMGNAEMGGIWWSRAQGAGVQLDWAVMEAADWDGQGLQHLAVSTRTLELLGEQEVRVLMRCLWAGDCLDCGYSLKGGVPALCVDDQYNRADAKLFHFGTCRYPVWNDSALVTVAKDSAFSWISFSGAVPIEDGEGLVPALFVNPALETASLILDGDSWSATSHCGPRTSLAEILDLKPIWQGLSGGNSRSKVLVGPGEIAVPGLMGVWSAPTADPLIEYIKDAGGIALVVTSAFGPNDVGAVELVNKILQSWDTMISWVPLGETEDY